jgi:two-component system sensor histidine kinase/response regulator
MPTDVPSRDGDGRFARLTKLYAALSQINQAIVRERTRPALFQRVCRSLADFGGFGLAWIGWPDPATGGLVPAASSGAIDPDLADGPMALAFGSGRACIVNDVLADPATADTGAALDRRGLRACAALPIRSGGRVRGALGVYADQRDVFHDREIALLEEAATDLSFALDNFARVEGRRQAERMLRDEKQFSDTMIDAMPGILYFYDAAGRFLRWNRHFETVSGYGPVEIAGMHPLDFFADDEKPIVRRRIEEVFEKGESSVEAAFRSKDGTTTPYFFTGRRLQFQGRPCLVGIGLDITERHRAERALRQSEERFRTTLESVTDAFVALDRDWRYTYVNERAARIFGRRREDLLGRHIWTEFPEGVGQPFHQAYERAMRERVEIQFEEYYPPYDAWFENRIYPTPDGIAIVFQDISARKRAEAALREANADLERRVGERTAALAEATRFLDALVDHLPEAVFYKDADLRFVGCNRAYERIFAVTREDIVGRTVLDLPYLPDADRQRYQEEQVELLARGGAVRREAEMPFADGRVHPTLYSVTAIRRPDGSPAGAVGTIVDVTALKETEAALERAMHAAEAADRIKSAFLATMSHELRTPLNSIIGFTGIMAKGLAGPLTAEQEKQLGMVQRSARHLLALVNDVLDISKIEAGQLEVAREPFDVQRAIANVLTLMTPQIEARGLALRTDVSPDLGEAIGDERRFRQIVLNLLSNAVKFTERGEVAVEVRLVGDAARPSIRIRVSDTGIGIKADALPTLFQPFRQADTGLTRSHEGTGLGLAICRRLAGLMGGEIAAESEWGKGSTFTVVLPVDGRSDP